MPAEAVQWPGHVLKAQVLEGGRGKRGLVRRLADVAEFASARQRITAALGDPAAPLLLEEAVTIAREIYLAVRIDGTRQGLELLVAAEGGEDVERTDALARIALDDADVVTADALYPALAELFTPDVAARLARYAARLPEIARREDLELLEINPLVLTPDGRFVACDAKIVRDDSAAFRHDPEEFPVSHSPGGARDDPARTIRARARLSTCRDRRRCRLGDRRRRSRHDDDGPAGRPRAHRRMLYG